MVATLWIPARVVKSMLKQQRGRALIWRRAREDPRSPSADTRRPVLARAQVFKPAGSADVLMMREYARGALKADSVLRVGRLDVRRKEVKADRALRAGAKRAAAKARPAALLHVPHM